MQKALSRSVAGTNHLFTRREEYERKVRAAQDTPLVKVPAIGNSRIREKRMTALLWQGKGEKVVQETTSRRVIVGLFRLEAASSRIPSSEGCPSEASATMEGRMLEPLGNLRSR